jgi:apolipoprotein N-acyltransferase
MNFRRLAGWFGLVLLSMAILMIGVCVAQHLNQQVANKVLFYGS